MGTAFRIEIAQRLEAQQRANRGLSYRISAEISAPVAGADDPGLPAGVKVRDVLASRLRLTAAEVKRRFRVAARIRPRRSLTGPDLQPGLPELQPRSRQGGSYSTTVTDDGRIAWSDGTGPPRTNAVHHPERLLDDT